MRRKRLLVEKRKIDRISRWRDYSKMGFTESKETRKCTWTTPIYFDDGSLSVMVGCPQCSGPIAIEIPDYHKIDWYGVLTPSCVCPYKCGYHHWMILNGWEHRVRPGDPGVKLVKRPPKEVPPILLPEPDYDFFRYHGYA